ncbi:MAG: Histidinol dehydrogenase [Cytophagales bacterium]|jgi:histidinol dehydrogenase|nr:histidinol dehydrogenase [Bacteroidota bacterium]MBS1979586.1 histidinol dehydrogenase [Bacteroidota bacterium]WHZ09213.1 MAG: Histidinol dehydrogenase [Cytophagales bacterium]
MKLYNRPPKYTWKELCLRPQLQTEFLEGRVQTILSRVKKSGDAALRELTRQYDKVDIQKIQVSDDEPMDAEQQLPDKLKQAIRTAAQNIKTFHALQTREEQKTETTEGVTCWRKAVPIEKVGIYIPGGSAPLFSTVLMLGIPAQLAGCNEIILCTPPDQYGKINPAILFSAKEVGIKKIFKVGGAQAIAAMAYGTESIPQVYKIVGPGNQFVTKAKQLVTLEGTAIDLPAGPSEVLVLADAYANAAYVAADLLSQAEHGTDSQVILVTNEETLIKKVVQELETQVAKLPRKEIAIEALKNSRAIILSHPDTIGFINEYAPEHLIINTIDCDELVNKITNAGSVFVGSYSPESGGDYASGTNHTLPTNGCAKSYSGVSLDSFVKYITFQKITKTGIEKLGPTVVAMAEAECLQAHAEAVKIRMTNP